MVGAYGVYRADVLLVRRDYTHMLLDIRAVHHGPSPTFGLMRSPLALSERVKQAPEGSATLTSLM